MVERMAALLALCAVILAGCDSRPRPFGSLFGDDGCKYKETTYSHGSTACQSGTQYQCDDGQWKGRGAACAESPPVAGKGCGLNGNSYSPGSASCQSGTQYRCDDGAWKNLVVACKSSDIEARIGRAPLSLQRRNRRDAVHHLQVGHHLSLRGQRVA